MIKIIAGGKKHPNWLNGICFEYEKRLKKPYNITWQFLDEAKLEKLLNVWPFQPTDYVICCDERGEIISSEEFSTKLKRAFSDYRNIIILIGGAYGFSEQIRKKADYLWSFSKLVFPHQIARLIATEQIYRASQIAINGPYHHQ